MYPQFAGSSAAGGSQREFRFVHRRYADGQRGVGAPESPEPERTLQRAAERCSVNNVASIPKATDLVRLSVSERLDLMEEIWASLAPDADAVPLPEWHVAEVRRRLAAFAADGNPGRSAEEVFAELKRRW